MIPYDALNFGFGWHKDVEEVARIVSENGIKSFSTTAPHLMDSAPTGPVILTKYMDKLWGKDKWIYNQGSCGSCVANGAGMAAEILVAEDITDNGAENPGRLDCMSIYWGSRVEIGGGRLSGEGSVGAWAAQYLQKYGCLPRKKYQSVDLTEYSAALCCSGYARKGVPDDLEPTAKLHPIKSYAKVDTWDELVSAITSGYPVTVASDQGFAYKRDANGFSAPKGSWSHQMIIIGIDLSDESAVVLNSWGNDWISGPKPDYMPAGSFKIRKKTAESMLKEGDSWAFSDLAGWKRKEIPWAKLNW